MWAQIYKVAAPTRTIGLVPLKKDYIQIKLETAPLFCSINICCDCAVVSLVNVGIETPANVVVGKPHIYNPCVISENNLVAFPAAVNPICVWVIVALAS